MDLRWKAAALSLALALPAVHPARAESNEELVQRLDALESELALVKRKLEVKQEEDETKAQTAALVSADKSGFQITSPDKTTFRLRIRGYAHFDSVTFLEKSSLLARERFQVSRARPIIEGTLLENIDFRLMPDFAGGSPTLFDAYINLRYLPEAQLQIGKYKAPIGLERLQSATANSFVERGLPTFLVPTRDLGLQVWGELREGLVSYAVGVFNGARDSGNADVGDIDSNDAKDVAARVFTQPFLETNWEALRGLG
ncbi:MAG: porin, partial [Myxococcota bacterium]